MRRRSPAFPQPGRSAGLRFVCSWLAALVLGASGLAAHDFWVEPSTFAPAPGQRVALGLWSGDRFTGEPVPRYAERLARFVVRGPEGELPVDGVEGVHPAGFITPRVPGPHRVVFETRPRLLTLAAERFEAYLREEGLERIVALRAERGESALPGRESYRRCAKSLLAVGGGGPVDEPSGCPLELVIEGPRPAAGGLAVRLLFGGAPLAGARVAALRRGADGPALAARSDADGRAVLAVEAPGVWLLKAVHMERAPEAAAADWQSWWASLTLQVAAPNADG